MKKSLLLIFTMITVLCHAQTEKNELTISRNEAVSIGLKNRFDIKANQYDVQIATTKIKQVKNNWLPEISADGNIKYSPQLQNSVIPGGILPGYDKTTLLPLMMKDETVFGLNLTQPVFNTNLTNDTRIAKNQLELQQEKNKETEINIIMQISQAYLDVQLRTLQKRISADIEARNKAYAALAEGMYRNGTLIENYFLRAKLDLENAEQLRKQADQNYDLSIMQLRYQMNVPEGTVLKPSDSLDAIIEETAGLTMQANERTEIRQLQLIQQGNQLDLKKIRQSVLPSVSLGANYSE